MHRDVVTHVAVSAAEFFITGSADGKLCCDCHFCNSIMFFERVKLFINYEFCSLAMSGLQSSLSIQFKRRDLFSYYLKFYIYFV
jgi:hypothetical protein